MHRIDGAGATFDNKFTEGDPAVPIAATTVTAKWANAVQEEIAAVVEAAGITLDDEQDDQLLEAILFHIGEKVLVGHAYTEMANTTKETGLQIPIDGSVPQSGEGAAVAELNTTYEPIYTDSILEVEVYLPSSGPADFTSGSEPVAGGTAVYALFRDAGADAIVATVVTGCAETGAAGPLNAFHVPVTLRALVVAGSTAATTFKLRFGRGDVGVNTKAEIAEHFGAAKKAYMIVRELRPAG